MGDLVLGSWRRTIVAGALAAAVVGAVVGLVGSGALRHANLPGHPYPPAGYQQNPFSPGDSDDLISTAEAARVKADLLRDGQVELQALQQGDATLLSQADTGNSLSKLRQLVEANNAAGVGERQQVRLDAVIVGRLPDPNDPGRGATWCVEEHGSGTVTRFARSTGQVVRTQDVAFDDRFWLVLVGHRYLITDVEVR